MQSMGNVGPAFAVSLMAGLLSSCGGSSSGGAPSAPVSTAPVISSAASASIPENSQGAVYLAAAVDPQGDPLAWDISGGADSARFVMDPGGVLSFRVAPNFDLPTDQGEDNVYDVTIRVTAGGETVTRALQVAVTNLREGIRVTRITTGFTEAVGMASALDDQHLVVAERGGRVFSLDGRTGARSEYSQLAANTRPGEVLDIVYLNQGIAYHRGLLLLTHSPADGLYLQGYDPVTGYRFQRKLADPWTARVQATLFATGRVPGEIMAGIGDATGLFAQSDASGYGKLYAITPGDPYAGASLRAEIILDVARIGRGLRAPSGGGLAGDQVLLADQGGSLQQELNRFQPLAAPLDFMWPTFEGIRPTGSVTSGSGQFPLLYYDHGQGAAQGTGIVAGVAYQGPVAGLIYQYVFGDKRGAIFSIPATRLLVPGQRDAAEIERRSLDFVPDVGTIDSPVDFVMANEALFILDSDGEVFRVER